MAAAQLPQATQATQSSSLALALGSALPCPPASALTDKWVTTKEEEEKKGNTALLLTAAASPAVKMLLFITAIDPGSLVETKKIRPALLRIHTLYPSQLSLLFCFVYL